VTNRDAAGRWVGFVYSLLKDTGHPALDVRWLSDRGPLGHALAVLDRDPYAASALAIDLSGLAGEPAPAAPEELTPMADRPGPAAECSCDGWEGLRDAPAGVVAALPAPAAGRYVIAREPPAIDGDAELRGEAREAERHESLALCWESARGETVIRPIDGSRLLLMFCHEDATWLPEGWGMDVYPVGWAPPHLERWFEYALSMAGMEDRNDIPEGRTGARPTPRRRGGWSPTRT
jgi:hypothetical protein